MKTTTIELTHEEIILISESIELNFQDLNLDGLITAKTLQPKLQKAHDEVCHAH